MMSKFFVALRNWLLPVAMVSGTILYFIISKISLFAPIRKDLLDVSDWLLPVTIFFTLFFTFCKIDFKEMKPRKWHFILLLSQTVMCVACMYVIVNFFNDEGFNKVLAEGIMACLLSPTATAAAVVTGKLGGSAASLTSYTLESNILSALLITVLCPLVNPLPDMDVFSAFFHVLFKISTLLLLPFILAFGLKYAMPHLHARLAALKDVSYYLWGFSLTIVTGLTVRMVWLNMSDGILEIALVSGAAIVCLFKFAYGKFIGHLYSKEDKISAGQALGQKNTSFTIWMALNFLNPIAAVAPGSYVIWQNIINSYQLWQKRKTDSARNI